MWCPVVAIAGIDGSGKTLLIRNTIASLKKKGVYSGYIDMPYFSEIRGWETWSRRFSVLFRWAETHSKLLIILLSLSSMTIYPFARWRLRRQKAGLIFVEHHPQIDLMPFGELYGGKVGKCIALFLSQLWQKPDATVFIAISPEQALQNVHRRNAYEKRGYQPHENLRQLRKFSALLEQSGNRLEKRFFSLHFPPDPSQLEELLSLYVLPRLSH